MKLIKKAEQGSSEFKNLFSAEATAEREGAVWPHGDPPEQVVAMKSLRGSEEESTRIEKAAYETGFHQGEKAGMELAEKKIEAVMRRYGDAIAEIGNLRATLYSQVEQDAVKLAVAVARKIVHREILADPEITQTMVRVALSRAAARSPIAIRLNPVDHRYLLDHKSEWLGIADGGMQVDLVADKSIGRGGCLIETECGNIDARIEEEFREVERSFFGDGGEP